MQCGSLDVHTFQGNFCTFLYILLRSLLMYIRLVIFVMLIHINVQLCRASWVEISGTKYSHKNVVVIDCNILPVFGVIQDIILNDTYQALFVCKKLTTCCFSPHYHAYEVSYSFPATFFICKPCDLYDYSVLTLYHVHSSLFVPLKYHIVEKFNDTHAQKFE